MPAKKKLLDNALHTLIDQSIPLEHRKRVLLHLCMEDSPESEQAVRSLFGAAAANNGQALQDKKVKELSQLIEEMQKGPLRSATFVKMLEADGLVRRAQVMLQDGETAFTVVPDVNLATSLRCGDIVLLEPQGRAVLGRDPAGIQVGEEARLERVIDRERVEITLRDHERHVFRASAILIDKLDAGQVDAGSMLLVCSRRSMAFDAVPIPDGWSHFWYLVRDLVPGVVVERDIGNPPPLIDELVEHVRTEMQDPVLGRRYRLRRSITKLLTGVSGSGKTLSIQGFWRRMFEEMSDFTGVPIEKLPPRVLKLRMPDVLSKWLGESDKRLDRFFDEAEQLADEKFVAPDGTEHELPVLAICEEVDALARARGDGDNVYDRILSTALERLDVNCRNLKDRLIIFLFTTNVPHLVDPAFLRRAGGTTERFGRLARRGFATVLGKHLRGLPFSPAYCARQAQAERRAVREVTDWLFSPNGQDTGQVELSFVGSTTPVAKHRRDFLTGALVDRATQQAAAEACLAERLGCDRPGLTCEMLICAFDCQIRSIVDQLTPENVGSYLTLPDGVRVASVRRLEGPSVLPIELERPT